jgi:hypothetical protein
MTEPKEGTAQRMLHRADVVRRARPALAFPFAVVKKFGDDRASRHAPLIAYREVLASRAVERRDRPEERVDVTFVESSEDDRR